MIIVQQKQKNFTQPANKSHCASLVKLNLSIFKRICNPHLVSADIEITRHILCTCANIICKSTVHIHTIAHHIALHNARPLQQFCTELRTEELLHALLLIGLVITK